MRTTDSELIRQLQQKMKKLDLFLVNHIAPEVLTELNGSNERAFFTNQVHEIFIKTAQTINEIWHLNLDLTEISNVKNLLDIVLEELTKKLKNQPPEASSDALRCVEDIIYLESMQLSSLANDIKKEIKAEQHAEFYRNLIKPFNDIWVFIRDSIYSLVNNLVLYFQTRADVEFQNIQQSTHLPCVHKSVTRSLNLLDARNPRPAAKEEVKELEKHTKKEIEQHIKAMELSAAQKDYAFNTLSRAKYDRAVDPHSGRTVMDTLVTMWIAAKDSAAYGPDDLDQDISSRKDLIIKHLALADREYNMDENGLDLGGTSKPACLGGTVNKIVESLEIIHPNVRIIRGQFILSDFCAEIFEVEFSNLSDEDQKIIFDYKNSSDVDENKTSIKANLLLDNIKLKIDDELHKINKEIFDGTVSRASMDEYLDNIIYIKLPDTEAVLRFKEDQYSSKSEDSQSELMTDKSIPIIVGDHLVSDSERSDFNASFNHMKRLFKTSNDIEIAKRCVKNAFDNTIWEKNDNLQQLAEKMLAQKKGILTNKQEAQKPVKEELTVDESAASLCRQRM